ncbi:MAG: hypothetical protein ACK4ZJ_16690, partial [Allorhizobium sp.]
KLRNAVHVRHVLPKPYFEARDRTRRGLVTRAQFLAVLDFLKLLALLSPPEVELLVDAFRSTEPGCADLVSYVQFCLQVDAGVQP